MNIGVWEKRREGGRSVEKEGGNEGRRDERKDGGRRGGREGGKEMGREYISLHLLSHTPLHPFRTRRKSTVLEPLEVCS